MKVRLGDNFKMYPYIPTLPWKGKRFFWKPFSARVDGFRMRVLKPEDAVAVSRLWAWGFPELYLGTYGFVMDPRQYQMFFGDEWRMFVFETTGRNSQVVGAWLLRMDKLNLSVDFTLVVVHPDFRRHGLLFATTKVLDNYVNACGVELATVACATFHVATRKVFRRLGFHAVGILPGAIRANVLRCRYRRDSVELLYKLYGAADEITTPITELEEGGGTS